MGYLNECPSSLSEIEKASTRLGCGNDKYGNNQYLCLPNVKKDSLIEFCYNGVMGMQEKGNCLESSKDGFILENCTHFAFGCPDKHFKSSEIFKYPACQAINRKLRCYMFDPLCQPTCGDDTCSCSNDEMDPGNYLNIALYVVMFCLGVAVGVLGLYLWKKYGKRFKGNKTRGEDETEKSNHQLFSIPRPEVTLNSYDAAKYGSQLSIIDGGRISRKEDRNIKCFLSRNESISSKATSNFSEPITTKERKVHQRYHFQHFKVPKDCIWLHTANSSSHLLDFH